MVGAVRFCHPDGALPEGDAVESVLGVGASLDDDGAFVHRTGVHQRHGDLVVAELLHQSADILRQPRSPTVSVEVAQTAVEGVAGAARGQSAEHQAGQRLGGGRVDAVHVVGQPRVGCGGVGAHALQLLAQALQILLDRSLRVTWVVAFQEAHPAVSAHPLQILTILGPVPHLEGAGAERVRPVVEPALVAVHIGVVHPTVDLLCVGVDSLDDTAPGVDVGQFSGHQQAVGEAVVRPAVAGGTVCPGAGLRHGDGEVPAVAAAVPLAAGLAADGAVEADVAGDDAAVVVGVLDPGIDVFQQPLPVLLLAGGGERHQTQLRGAQVERVVADDVGVLSEVIEHLRVSALAVPEGETVRHFDGITGPVEGGRLAHQGSAAAVEHGADDAMLGVVIGRLRILVHVEAGKAAATADVVGVIGVAEPVQQKRRQPFAMVEPVEGDGKFFVVHAVSGHRHFDRLRFRVLAQMTFQAASEQIENAVVSAEGVKHRPVELVLGGIVGSVVAAPAGHTFEVAAPVEILVVELGTGLCLHLEELALQQGPPRRCQGRVNGNEG